MITIEQYIDHIKQNYRFDLLSNGQQTIVGFGDSIVNLDPEFIREIAKQLGLGFVQENEPAGNLCLANSSEIRDDYRTTFAPIDLLDYTCAVVHSSNYRHNHSAISQIDFPGALYPKDPTTFWKLVHLGGQIRRIHLLESATVEKFITQYPVNGDNVVTKPRFVLNEPAPVVIQNEAELNRVENTAFNEGYERSSEESLENRDSSFVGMTTQPIKSTTVIQNEAELNRVENTAFNEGYERSSEESLENRDSSSVGMTTQPIKSTTVIHNEAQPSEESLDQPALTGKVYINDSQYFDRVPQVAWEFYIGGYQPAQKWLKDRKGRALEVNDILHYQNIIVAQTETYRLMKEIDGIELED